MNTKSAQFETKRGWYADRPTLEILKNGEPFWEDIKGAKEHFRFGLKKARMILTCLAVIRQFFDSGGVLPSDEAPVVVESREWKSRCRVTRHSGFERASGAWVNKPYLKLVSSKTISFGLLKAEALLQLEPEIRHFALDAY